VSYALVFAVLLAVLAGICVLGWRLNDKEDECDWCE